MISNGNNNFLKSLTFLISLDVISVDVKFQIFMLKTKIKTNGDPWTEQETISTIGSNKSSSSDIIEIINNNKN